jgi:hypothetical protein
VTGVFVAIGVAAGGRGAGASTSGWCRAANAAAADVYWRLTAGRTGLFRLAAQRVPIDGFTLRFERVDATAPCATCASSAGTATCTRSAGRERATFEGQDLVLLRPPHAAARPRALDVEGQDAERSCGRWSARRARRGATRRWCCRPASTRRARRALQRRRLRGPALADAAVGRRRDAGLGRERREATVLLHRKLAEPVSNVALLLVAVPLSIAFARSRAVAFGLALLVTLAWYLLYTFGQLLSLTGVIPTWVGPWAANLLLGAGSACCGGGGGDGAADASPASRRPGPAW